jgi:hypothetical protein
VKASGLKILGNASKNKQTLPKKRLSRNFIQEIKAIQQNKPNSSFTPEPLQVQSWLESGL